MTIAKLHAYGFDKALLIHSCLIDRHKRCSRQDQGSILDPILFNIHLHDIFFMFDVVDIASYADDNILYSIETNQCELEKKYTKVISQAF